MTTHLAAFSQSINSATLVNVNSVQDDVLTRPAADRFQVPIDYKSLHAVMATGVDITRAQLVSPSLETKRVSLEVVPRQRGAASVDLTHPQVMQPKAPIVFDGTENLTFQAAEDNAAASICRAFVWLKAPGDLPPMPDGDIRVVRATGTTTLVAESWTSVPLTLDKDLQPGLYALCGMYAMSATAIAARALITGQVYRPGVPAFGAAEAAGVDFDRLILDALMWYNMGQFAHTNVPQIQFFATAGDTAETVFLYVKRIGEAPGAT